jgi:hypothetical protein
MFSLCICTVALVIRHANPIFLRSILLLSVASLGLPDFSHYLTNATIFGGKVTEQDMCFDFL